AETRRRSSGCAPCRVATARGSFAQRYLQVDASSRKVRRRLPAGGKGIRTCMGLFLSSGVFGLLPVLCSEREGRSSSRRLRSGSRSARKGSRDRNASKAWRLAALASLVFRSALTPEHAEGR